MIIARIAFHVCDADSLTVESWSFGGFNADTGRGGEGDSTKGWLFLGFSRK